MPVDIDSPEGHLIRKMVPFSTMPNNIFKVICNKVIIENARSGTFLFKRGDAKNDLVYLLKGEVSLEVGKLKMEIIKAGTESARFAMAHQIPRKTHAVAKGSVRFMRLNSIFIKPPDLPEIEKKEKGLLLNDKEIEGLKKKQEDKALIRKANTQDSHDWIATLLMIPIIRTLPPANMNKIAEVLEEINYKKDDVIIQQGEMGSYYYFIKEGSCLVSHKNSQNSSEMKIAKLQSWDTFGEAALFSGEPRSETISALSEVSLLRIHKDKFLKLIKEPVLQFVEYVEMDMMLVEGAVLLDVRSPDEYEVIHLEYSINAPLYSLRSFLKNLDKDAEIIICCLDGKISEFAAFILLTHKFSVKILRGGIKKAPKEALKKAQQTTANKKVHEDVVFGSSENVSAEAKVELFSTENARLRKMVQELKLRAEKVEQEKSDLEKKYKQLFKQAERLKAMLESLTK